MEALGDQFIEEMHELSEKGGSWKIQQFKQDLEVTEKRIAEIDSVIMKLFEQNALGKISDERFEKMSSVYESEQQELNHKRDELRTKIRDIYKNNIVKRESHSREKRTLSFLCLIKFYTDYFAFFYFYCFINCEICQ